jgi:hypothetical protein
MPEDLICKGQKVLTKEGRTNWDKIFGGATLDNVIPMEKKGSRVWVPLNKVKDWRKRGWRKSK